MSEAQETLELSEAQIAVHWREEEYIYPPAPFIAQANMTDSQILSGLIWSIFLSILKNTPIY